MVASKSDSARGPQQSVTHVCVEKRFCSWATAIGDAWLRRKAILLLFAMATTIHMGNLDCGGGTVVAKPWRCLIGVYKLSWQSKTRLENLIVVTSCPLPPSALRPPRTPPPLPHPTPWYPKVSPSNYPCSKCCADSARGAKQ